MGHGAEKYGYNRPTEQDLASELEKLWEYTQPATKSEVENLKESRKQADAQFEARLREAEGELDAKLVEKWDLMNLVLATAEKAGVTPTFNSRGKIVFLPGSPRERRTKELGEQWKRLHPGEKEPEVKLLENGKLVTLAAPKVKRTAKSKKKK